MRRLRLVIWSTVLVLLPLTAQAHNLWLSPTPRDSNSGNTTAPCGVPKPLNATQNYTVGQTVTVQWQVVIQHSGPFAVYFSPANDLNFSTTPLATAPEVNDGTIPKNYSAQITIPNTPCVNCTLQVVQTATDNGPGVAYYSCADINILAVGAAPPTPTPTSTAGGPIGTQGVGGGPTSNNSQQGQMGSCARVEDINGSGPGMGGGMMIAALFLIPLALVVFLNRRRAVKI